MQDQGFIREDGTIDMRRALTAGRRARAETFHAGLTGVAETLWSRPAPKGRRRW